METLAELLRTGQRREVWRRCCGFVDLSLQEFMGIQERLLLEQLELLNRCQLGDKLLKGRKPKTMAEFREMAPLTTYADYIPELLEMREDVLPAKPVFWQRTSGRSGEYACKWIPITAEYNRQVATAIIGAMILASCEEREDVRLEPNDTVLYGLAPPPYCSGAICRAADESFPLRWLPPIREAEKMGFQERLQRGFLDGLDLGMDFYLGMTSVLVAMGEQISQRSGSMSLLSQLDQPRTIPRLAAALAKSKLTGEPILPKHLWKIKGIYVGGADTGVLRERVKALWGRYPLDSYASAECTSMAIQTWDYSTMTFVPNLAFLEGARHVSGKDEERRGRRGLPKEGTLSR